MSKALATAASMVIPPTASPPPPVNPLRVLQNTIKDAQTAERIATNIMTGIVEAATVCMISNHYDRLAVPYTVQCVSAEIVDYIQSAFVGLDTGFINAAAWLPDATPIEVGIDSWARAAIHVAPKRTGASSLSALSDPLSAAASPITPAPKPSGKRTTAAASPAASTKAGDSRASPAPPAIAGAATAGRPSVQAATSSVKATGSTAGKKPSAAASHNATASAAGGDTATAGSAETAGALNMSVMSQEEIDYTNMVKADQKQKQERKQLGERLTRQMEDSKAKDFLIDNGQVILLKSPAEAAGNNAKKQELRFGILAPAEPQPSGGATGGQKGLNPVRGGAAAATAAGSTQPRTTKGGPNAGGGGRRPLAMDFYQEDPSALQPMVEAFQPAGGVGVKEGDAAGVRRADFKVPKAKLSRSEFKQLAQESSFGGGPNDGPNVVEDAPRVPLPKLRTLDSSAPIGASNDGSGGGPSSGVGASSAADVASKPIFDVKPKDREARLKMAASASSVPARHVDGQATVDVSPRQSRTNAARAALEKVRSAPANQRASPVLAGGGSKAAVVHGTFVDDNEY